MDVFFLLVGAWFVLAVVALAMWLVKAMWLAEDYQRTHPGVSTFRAIMESPDLAEWTFGVFR